jgi:PAS domain-containing protein
MRSGPVIACGMASYNPEVDRNFNEVYVRADGRMYANKKELKSRNLMGEIKRRESSNVMMPDDQIRKLDGLYGALHTVAGGGYVFLTNLKYNFSRWSLSVVTDFGLPTEYMYDVEGIWKNYIHPDDIERYEDAVASVLEGTPVLYSISYRARKADGTYIILKPRGFILNDINGVPEYFGGIMIPQ